MAILEDLEVDKVIASKKVNFISPEDLIINKLLWHKESESTRHLEDIESVLKISKIDKKYLNSRAETLDLKQELDRILKKNS